MAARRSELLVIVLLVLAPAALAADAGAKPQVLRVGLVQMALAPTLAGNRDRIVRGIERVAEQRGRVAVFPEGALTGSGDGRRENIDEAVAAIRHAARERQIYVISGAHTWLPSIQRNGNWMFAIGADGRELMRYEKIYDNHRAKMPGVFLIDGVPVSTAICADRWLRGVVEIPIQQGSQIFFELSNNYACEWVEPYGWYWNAPLARRNTVWSIFCNTGNEAGGKAAAPNQLKHGHSAIIAPDGRVVAATSGDAEDIVFANLDLSQATRMMARLRGTHPVLQTFWEAGEKIQRGEAISAQGFQALKSPTVDVTLAAAPVVGDLARMEALIAEARGRQADLIAFPARASGEEALDRLRAAARQSQIAVVFGAKHRGADGEHNSAFVIGPDGELLTRYDQLSADSPLKPGTAPQAMWFQIKGVPAVVTLERDALWTELSELPAVAGAQIHIHLDHDADESAASKQQRLQTWVTCASFLTFSATVGNQNAILWDDLHSREESRAEVRGTPRPDSGKVVVLSPFSANLIEEAKAGELIVATRRVSATNPHHPMRTANMNPQMKAWYELGAQLIGPR
jgi:predicted amidohydrolase